MNFLLISLMCFLTYYNAVDQNIVNNKINFDKIVVEFEYSGKLANENNSPFNFSIKYKVNCFKDSSVLVLSDEEKSNDPNTDPVTIKMPEKIIFKKNKWYKPNEANKPIPFIKEKVIKTNLTCLILGYTCYKYISTNTETKNVSEVWICPKLPNNIMPAAGCKPLPGAILKIISKIPSEIYEAKSIQIIKQKRLEKK